MTDLARAIAQGAAALRIEQASLRTKIDVARCAGWEGMDAVTTAWLALADPAGDCHAGSRVAADAVDAAIWRRCPRRRANAAGRLVSALREVRGDWRDHVPVSYDYRLPLPHDPQVARRAKTKNISRTAALAELRRERLLELAFASARAQFGGRSLRARAMRARFRAGRAVEIVGAEP